jgi:hypothetical protein
VLPTSARVWEKMRGERERERMVEATRKDGRIVPALKMPFPYLSGAINYFIREMFIFVHSIKARTSLPRGILRINSNQLLNIYKRLKLPHVTCVLI